MRRLIFLRIASILLFTLLLGTSAYGWPWGKSWLVKINGVEYTKEDFIHWWENWRDKNTPLPDTLEPFVDWFLLFQEGERMKLYEDPTYQKKVRVFLEVRSLMLLKEEEVDSKIKIDPKEVKRIYEERYVPLLHVRAVVFPDEKAAREFLSEIKKGEGLERLVIEKLGKNNRRAFDWGWRRPFVFPDYVRSRLLKLKKGEVTGPVKWMGKYWLLELVDKKEGGKEDFERVKRGIERSLWKQEEGRLTMELLERLKKKYHVWVDEKLLKSLDVEHPDKAEMDRVIVKMGKVELKVKDFIALVKKELAFRKKYRFPTEDMNKIKELVVDNLISQTLTSWEALDRHYERKPPFKWVFEFYCQHRIIRELENQLFWPRVKVTDEEAKKYYQEHLKDFELPTLVKVAVVQTSDEKVALKMGKAIDRGEDFFSVARKFTLHDAVVERIPVDHLPAEVRRILEKLSPGEVGGPVKVGEFFYLVKLIDRFSGREKPFRAVKKDIVKKLREQKFKEIKAQYLAELKKRSRIEVNEAAWKKLREELRREYGGEEKSG